MQEQNNGQIPSLLQNGRYNLEEEIQFLGYLLIQLCRWWLHYLFLSKSNLAEEPASLQQQLRPGRMSLFSASGSVLIKQSLQKHCKSAHRHCFYQNKYGQQSLADSAMLRQSNFLEPIHFWESLCQFSTASNTTCHTQKGPYVTATDIIDPQKVLKTVCVLGAPISISIHVTVFNTFVAMMCLDQGKGEEKL